MTTTRAGRTQPYSALMSETSSCKPDRYAAGRSGDRSPVEPKLRSAGDAENHPPINAGTIARLKLNSHYQSE